MVVPMEGGDSTRMGGAMDETGWVFNFRRIGDGVFTDKILKFTRRIRSLTSCKIHWASVARANRSEDREGFGSTGGKKKRVSPCQNIELDDVLLGI